MSFTYNPPPTLTDPGLTPSSVTLIWGASTLINNNVALLLHFDGTNGQMTTVDSSLYGHTMSFGTGCSLSTSSPKFGSACASFITTSINPNATIWTTIVQGSILDILSGSSDFTIEGWFRVDGSAFDTAFIVMDFGSNTTSGGLDAGLQVVASISSVTGLTSVTLSTGIHSSVSGLPWGNFTRQNILSSFGAWIHFAICRISGQGSFYVDGVAATLGGNATWNGYTFPTGSRVQFGNNDNGGGSVSKGSVDEVLITAGTAKYTGPFTPPASPFPNPGPPPGYIVYKGGADYAQVIGSGITTYTDSVVIPGDTYVYTVAAQDGFDVPISDLSPPLSVTIPFAVRPSYGKFVKSAVYKAVEISRVGGIIPRIWPTRKNNTVQA